MAFVLVPGDLPAILEVAEVLILARPRVHRPGLAGGRVLHESNPLIGPIARIDKRILRKCPLVCCGARHFVPP